MPRPGLTQERLVALFLFGVLLFTPPILSIFNVPDRIVGLPSLYLYLFAAWTLLILLVAVVVESSTDEEGPARTAEDLPGGSELTSDRTEG
jgi:hypothetical protein